MIHGRNFFHQRLNNKVRTYDNIRMIANSRVDDNMTDFLLDYHYFKDHYKEIIIDLSKQPALNANANAIQQINLTGNLNANATIFLILEEIKETILEEGTMRVL